MSGSIVPVVLDALVAKATAALPSVGVHDGPVLSEKPPADLLYIGVSDEDDTINGAQSWAGSGASSRNDEFDVPCMAWSKNGNAKQIKATRDRAFATWAAFELALRADPTLGISGHVVRAEMAIAYGVSQRQDQGFICAIRFTVHCKTRI